MNMQLVNSLEDSTWQSFVDQNPYGNIYHTPQMFQVFAKSEKHKPTFWAVIDQSKHPLALLTPVEITLRNGLFFEWTTRAVAYGSVLNAPGPEGRAALQLLLKTYCSKMQGHILFTEFRNLFNLGEQQPTLNEEKFLLEDHLNYLIDLDQSEEMLWHNIDRRWHCQSCRSQ